MRHMCGDVVVSVATGTLHYTGKAQYDGTCPINTSVYNVSVPVSAVSPFAIPQPDPADIPTTLPAPAVTPRPIPLDSGTLLDVPVVLRPPHRAVSLAGEPIPWSFESAELSPPPVSRAPLAPAPIVAGGLSTPTPPHVTVAGESLPDDVSDCARLQRPRQDPRYV